MSDALNKLYRYLSQNQDRKDEDNPYNAALRALDDFYNIIENLEYWGRYITEQGGITWEDAKVIRDRIIDGSKTTLCQSANQSSAKALVDFASTHVKLTGSDYDAILIGLEALRALQIEEDSIYPLGDIEDNPFA